MAIISAKLNEVRDLTRQLRRMDETCSEAKKSAEQARNILEEMSFSGRDSLTAGILTANRDMQKQQDLMTRMGGMIEKLVDEFHEADQLGDSAGASLPMNDPMRLFEASVNANTVSLATTEAMQRNAAAAGLILGGAAHGFGAGKSSFSFITDIFHKFKEKMESIRKKYPPVQYNVPVYDQHNREWSSKKYDGIASIGEYGCTITCIAMLESYYRKESITPDNIVEELGMTFDSYSQLKWSSVKDDGYVKENLPSGNTDESLVSIYNHLKEGPVIIGGMNISTNSNHFMVVQAYTGDGKPPLKAEDFQLVNNYPKEYCKTGKGIPTLADFMDPNNDASPNDHWEKLLTVVYKTNTNS